MTGTDFNDSEIEDQRCSIKSLLQKPMKVGATWYLIDAAWFRQWKRYVCYEPESEEQTDSARASPGAIDNRSLCRDDGELRAHMLDGSDYELLPRQAWDRLVTWYGLASVHPDTTQRHIIARKVISYGQHVKEAKVEVYLVELRLCSHDNLERVLVRQFSKQDTVGQVEREARRLLSAPVDRPSRLWMRYTTNTYELLASGDVTVAAVGLYSGQTVVLEVRRPDGCWPRPTPSQSVANNVNETPVFSMVTRYGQIGLSPGSGSAGSSTAPGSTNGATPYTPGLCGLANLGNTCFMNSVLQCLSHTPPLRRYFVAGRHLNELNADNPLGMGGEIARTFGALLHDMWSGRHQSVVPRAFKSQVSRFAPQFSGYQQHDSQEMLTFILDALNEDLNRVRKKPYIELKDADGRPDAVVAEEAWHNYLKRNNSVISDLFFGLLKSTVVCPQCDKVSVTFDPFCMLQLPLLVKQERQIEVCVVFDDSSRRPMLYKVAVSKLGTTADLLRAVSQASLIEAARLVLTEMSQRSFRTVFTGTEPLRSIADRDAIYAYELPPQSACSVRLPVLVRRGEHGQAECQSFFVSVRQRCSYSQLAAAVERAMTRYLRLSPAQWQQQQQQQQHDSNTTAANGDLDSDDDEYVCDDTHSDGQCVGTCDGNMDTSDHLNTNTSSKSDGGGASCLAYRLLITNRAGSSVLLRPVPPCPSAPSSQQQQPESPLPLPAGECAVLVAWQTVAFTACVDTVEERARLQHQSVQARLPRRASVQLAECVDMFITTEKLGANDAWYCPTCKKHQEATKKFDLWSLPDILVVHLKRFSYTRILRDKIDVLVEFPVRELDMTPHVINPSHGDAVYDLIGVSNHFGGLGGGHYVAVCRQHDTGNWYTLDDSSVSSASQDSVCTKSAYVLFYMRRGRSGADSESSPLSPSLSCSAATAPAAGSSDDDNADSDMDSG